MRPPPPARSDITYRQFGEQWTSGALHLLHPDHVKAGDHTDNRTRLANYVYPVVGDIPLKDLRLDDLDKIFKQPNLPAGSRRHIALVARRVLSLAVYPGMRIPEVPVPQGWLPNPSPKKQKSFLYPSEDLALMRTTSIPLVVRMLIGILGREGLGKEEAANLEWGDLELDSAGGAGVITLAENKTDDPRAWVLDEGSVDALRRWKKVVGNSRWVFPAALVSKRKKPEGHVYVDHLSRELRDGLVEAGVTRPALLAHDSKRQRLRAHDLRATFVTLSLASGHSAAWVQARTGHTLSAMIARYRREPRLAIEARLGWLHPLHLAIPELTALGDDERESSDQTSGAAEDDAGGDDPRRANAA